MGVARLLLSLNSCILSVEVAHFERLTSLSSRFRVRTTEDRIRRNTYILSMPYRVHVYISFMVTLRRFERLKMKSRSGNEGGSGVDGCHSTIAHSNAPFLSRSTSVYLDLSSTAPPFKTDKSKRTLRALDEAHGVDVSRDSPSAARMRLPALLPPRCEVPP